MRWAIGELVGWLPALIMYALVGILILSDFFFPFEGEPTGSNPWLLASVGVYCIGIVILIYGIAKRLESESKRLERESKP